MMMFVFASGASETTNSQINVRSVSVVPNSGNVGIGDKVKAIIVASQEGLAVNAEACSINGNQVAETFTDEGSGTYTLTYEVKENDNDRSAGTLPISCELHVKTTEEENAEETNETMRATAPSSSTVTRIFKFTEKNTLAVDAHRPVLLKASVVRIIPGSPVGIGGRIVIKIEGSASDEGLMLGDCRANIPMPWVETDEANKKTIISMSQQQSKRDAGRDADSAEEKRVEGSGARERSEGKKASSEDELHESRRKLVDDATEKFRFLEVEQRHRAALEKNVDAEDDDRAMAKAFASAETIGGEQVTGFMEIGRGLYIVEYRVAEGNADQLQGELPFVCTLLDKARNAATVGPIRLYRSDLVIDAHAPVITATRLHYASSSPALMGTNITVAIVATEVGLKPTSCLLDNFDAMESHSSDRDLALDPSGTSYFFSWSVPSSQGDWAPGRMPIDCVLVDAAGNEKRTTAFTDGNTLAGTTHSPGLMDYVPNLALVVRFVLVSIAASTVGKIAPTFGLPQITGYLLMGMVAGPFMLGLIPESDIRSLRFVDELSLAFIAFSAGGKLHLSELQERFRSVMYVTLGLVIFEYVIGSGTIMLLAQHIEFMKGMDSLQTTAVGLMAGALVIARSPASAIAIVRELRCERGRFTQLILGVTVVMDLVVIALFALTSLVSNALLAKTQRVGAVLGVFVVQVGLSTLLGLGLGAMLPWVLYVPRGPIALRIAQLCDRAVCGASCCPLSLRHYSFERQLKESNLDEDEDMAGDEYNDVFDPLLPSEGVKRRHVDITKIADEGGKRSSDAADNIDDSCAKTPLLIDEPVTRARRRWDVQTKTPGRYSRLHWLREENDGFGGSEKVEGSSLDAHWESRRRQRRRRRRVPLMLSMLVCTMDALLLLTGFATFALAHGVEPLLQPLIICMVAGFICVNFTRSGFAFVDAEDRIGPIVYVAFFTLTGAALDLNSVAPNIALATIIALGRIVGIFLGAYTGGRLAGEPDFESRRAWMAYVTQAGVALGLAKKVHLEYRVWGGSFATMFVTVVVINQLIGPPLFRFVLRTVENRAAFNFVSPKTKRPPETGRNSPDASSSVRNGDAAREKDWKVLSDERRRCQRGEDDEKSEKDGDSSSIDQTRSLVPASLEKTSASWLRLSDQNVRHIEENGSSSHAAPRKFRGRAAGDDETQGEGAG